MEKQKCHLTKQNHHSKGLALLEVVIKFIFGFNKAKAEKKSEFQKFTEIKKNENFVRVLIFYLQKFMNLVWRGFYASYTYCGGLRIKYEELVDFYAIIPCMHLYIYICYLGFQGTLTVFSI